MRQKLWLYLFALVLVPIVALADVGVTVKIGGAPQRVRPGPNLLIGPDSFKTQTGFTDELYFASDTNAVYRGTGTAWTLAGLTVQSIQLGSLTGPVITAVGNSVNISSLSTTGIVCSSQTLPLAYLSGDMCLPVVLQASPGAPGPNVAVLRVHPGNGGTCKLVWQAGNSLAETVISTTAC